MKIQSLSHSVQSEDFHWPSIKLWFPNVIGWIAFLLGFPAGIVLASINWIRMKRTGKAAIYLFGCLIGVLAIILLRLIIPDELGLLQIGLILIVNTVTAYHLYVQMTKDIAVVTASGTVAMDANWFGGCLLGFIASILISLCISSIGFLILWSI
jgi:hypothetical protein